MKTTKYERKARTIKVEFVLGMSYTGSEKRETVYYDVEDLTEETYPSKETIDEALEIECRNWISNHVDYGFSWEPCE